MDEKKENGCGGVKLKKLPCGCVIEVVGNRVVFIEVNLACKIHRPSRT